MRKRKTTSLSETRQIIKLLRQEFSRSFKSVAAKRILGTEAIVVLSGKVAKRGTTITSRIGENVRRVRRGVKLHRQIVAIATTMDVLPPLLVLNGTIEQLPELEALAFEADAHPHLLLMLSCGTIGHANTGTQMDAVRVHPHLGKLRHATFVTSWYHVPRAVRTADQHLPPSMQFLVIGEVGPGPTAQQKKMQKEIERILKYGQRGDLRIIPERSSSFPPKKEKNRTKENNRSKT